MFVVDNDNSLKCTVCFRSPTLCTKVESFVVNFLTAVFEPSVDDGIRTTILNCVRCWRS